MPSAAHGRDRARSSRHAAKRHRAFSLCAAANAGDSSRQAVVAKQGAGLSGAADDASGRRKTPWPTASAVPTTAPHRGRPVTDGATRSTLARGLPRPLAFSPSARRAARVASRVRSSTRSPIGGRRALMSAADDGGAWVIQRRPVDARRGVPAFTMANRRAAGVRQPGIVASRLKVSRTPGWRIRVAPS